MSAGKAILTIPGAVGAAVEKAVYEYTGDAKTAATAGQIAKWGTIVATADVCSGIVETVTELAIDFAVEQAPETSIEEIGTIVLTPVLFLASQKNDNGSNSNYKGNTQIGGGNSLSA